MHLAPSGLIPVVFASLKPPAKFYKAYRLKDQAKVIAARRYWRQQILHVQWYAT